MKKFELTNLQNKERPFFIFQIRNFLENFPKSSVFALMLPVFVLKWIFEKRGGGVHALAPASYTHV